MHSTRSFRKSTVLQQKAHRAPKGHSTPLAILPVIFRPTHPSRARTSGNQSVRSSWKVMTASCRWAGQMLSVSSYAIISTKMHSRAQEAAARWRRSSRCKAAGHCAAEPSQL